MDGPRRDQPRSRQGHVAQAPRPGLSRPGPLGPGWEREPRVGRPGPFTHRVRRPLDGGIGQAGSEERRGGASAGGLPACGPGSGPGARGGAQARPSGVRAPPATTARTSPAAMATSAGHCPGCQCPGCKRRPGCPGATSAGGTPVMAGHGNTCGRGAATLPGGCGEAGCSGPNSCGGSGKPAGLCEAQIVLAGAAGENSARGPAPEFWQSFKILGCDRSADNLARQFAGAGARRTGLSGLLGCDCAVLSSSVVLLWIGTAQG
jgi:hypothetical protein